MSSSLERLANGCILAGFAGSLIGIGAGIVAAFALAGTVGSLTEQMVGVAQRTSEVVIEPWLLTAAMLIGISTSIIAAWVPARAAAIQATRAATRDPTAHP